MLSVVDSLNLLYNKTVGRTKKDTICRYGVKFFVFIDGTRFLIKTF